MTPSLSSTTAAGQKQSIGAALQTGRLMSTQSLCNGAEQRYKNHYDLHTCVIVAIAVCAAERGARPGEVPPSL